MLSDVYDEHISIEDETGPIFDVGLYRILGQGWQFVLSKNYQVVANESGYPTRRAAVAAAEVAAYRNYTGAHTR